MSQSPDDYVERFLEVSKVALGLGPEGRPSPGTHVLQREVPEVRARARFAEPLDPFRQRSLSIQRGSQASTRRDGPVTAVGSSAAPFKSRL
ncbi:MAG: hypothetical protein JWM26_166 [Betaproteobacteria bacterium]|jgi:hypothetical protein|nr:hypothetical protein [Betaproteobacteria bacterium]